MGKQHPAEEGQDWGMTYPDAVDKSLYPSGSQLPHMNREDN